MTPSPTQDNVCAALRSFLLDVLPAGTGVIIALDNRVSEPIETEFVIMTPLRFQRMRTNIDSDADVKFTGSIDGTVLTVTDVDFGAIAEGATIFGVGVIPTKVTNFQSGTGGVGTYLVDQTQTVFSTTISSGGKTIEQGAQVSIQLDFHSASGAAGDMAQTVSTLFRDEYATEQFAAQEPNYNVYPLFADDPRMAPFINESQQYEWRWTLEANLQVNQIIAIPQQYADSIDLEVRSVDVVFPP